MSYHERSCSPMGKHGTWCSLSVMLPSLVILWRTRCTCLGYVRSYPVPQVIEGSLSLAVMNLTSGTWAIAWAFCGWDNHHWLPSASQKEMVDGRSMLINPLYLMVNQQLFMDKLIVTYWIWHSVHPHCWLVPPNCGLGDGCPFWGGLRPIPISITGIMRHLLTSVNPM